MTETPDFVKIVAGVKSDDQSSMEQLYRLFSRGIRYYLCRQLGPQELEDKVHDVFLIVVNAIRRGDIREPERLMGFVRTVVRRQVASYIEDIVARRREKLDVDSKMPELRDERHNPEREAMITEHSELMRTTLARLGERDRNILVRFYLWEQPQSQICEEMKMTETQFRLFKSRAKVKFGELGRDLLKNSKATLQAA